MAMKLKVDDAGHAVVKDGNPIYVHDDGKEIPFDAAATLSTISRLNGEAKSHRERAEAAEGKLDEFKSIPDVKAAVAALEIVGKLDAKKLIDAGEVDKVRAEAKKAFDDQLRAVDEKYAPVVKKAADLEAALVSEKVGGAFSRSKFISDKLAIPVDMVQARFGEAFKLENGEVIAYDKQGNKIFSRANPGNVASFEEAMEILVDGYPYKDNILKGTGASGGGSGGGGGSNGSKTVSRSVLATLTPAAQAAHFKAGGAVVDG